MINVSKEFKEKIKYGRFLLYLIITLADGTVLNLDDSNIWEGGFKIDEGVTESGAFTIGSCIINKMTVTLYQTEEGTILHKFNTRSATGRVYTGFEVEKQVTPEQQQTLLSKLETQIKADLNDHTERLKNELTEKGKEILDGFGESGSVSEELKAIKQDLSTKLTAPPTPEPGKILKIRSVNEDGTFTCEWADDGGSNLDVE